MKKALLGVVITRIGGTTFADGGQQVKVMLEEGYSFNLSPTSPILPKICEGQEIDLTYNNNTKKEGAPTTSGAVFTFNNLSGVKIIAVRPGQVDAFIAGLETVTDVTKIVFKEVGGGTGTPGTSAAPKV